MSRLQSLKGRAVIVMHRFVVAVDRLQNVNVVIRIGAVIVIQCVDGAEMVGEAIVLIVSWR